MCAGSTRVGSKGARRPQGGSGNGHSRRAYHAGHAQAVRRRTRRSLGATVQQLRRLVDLGILTPTPQGRYRRSDIQRIRVVDALADAGFAPEQLGELIAAGAYNLDWASVVFPEPTSQMTSTLEQTAAATGLPESFLGRLYDAWELPRPQPGQALRADDDELLHLAAGALEAFGRDETALLGAARQLGDSLRRLAES
jgi:DNA-binding transcriptional MerR regulator